MADGTTFDYDRAEALGLIDKQLDADSDDAFLDAILERRRCPTARRTRPACRSGSSSAPSRAAWTCRSSPASPSSASCRQRLFTSADAKEGIAAFVEKRKADFQGR